MEETSNEHKRNGGNETNPIKVSWISAHSDVRGNEMADGEAKLASMGKTSATDALPHLLRHPLPKNASAVKQDFHERLKTRWKKRWKNSSRYDKFSRLDNQFPFSNFNKARDSLTRQQASLIVQTRTGHAPIDGFLHRIKKRENAKCDSCLENFGIDTTETVRHFLFECKT